MILSVLLDRGIQRIFYCPVFRVLNNAHPHLSIHREVVLVHNSIIENFADLKNFLQENGYSFYSDTDTEVAVNLIEYFYLKEKNVLKALLLVQKELKGSYAFAIMFKDDANTLYAMRKDSPLVVGKGENGFYPASDISAFLDYTKEFYKLENKEILRLTETEIHLYNKNGEEVNRSSTVTELDSSIIHKGEYLHFMEKEIFEQPQAVQDTLLYACNKENNEFSYTAFSMSEKDFRDITRVRVIACGSAIAGESDFVFYTQAGPEIAVATTKDYSCQLVAGYIFSLLLAKAKGKIGDKEAHILKDELFKLLGKIQQCLSLDSETLPMAKKLKDDKNIFFLGRGLDWAVSMEGALKLKEISYIHCESYSSGELKHGTISLIEKDSPVIALLSQEELAGKSISNIHEVKSRGAKCFTITMEDISVEEDDFAQILSVPKTHPLFAGSLLVVSLQFLSYQVSLLKGLDPDKPRNLAKSVTVE